MAADFFAGLEDARGPGGPSKRIEQIVADPQIAARGLLQRMARWDGTPVTVIGSPGNPSRTRATYRVAPQTHREDTETLFAEFGVHEATGARLRKEGVIDGRS